MSIKPNIETVARAAQAAWSYELAGHGPALWELRERRSGEWLIADRFDDQRQHVADVVVANHFSSTFPRSPLVGQFVAVRKDANAIHRLLRRTFTVTGSDRTDKEDELDDRAVTDVLHVSFGLSLDADQRERLLDALPALGGADQTQ